MSAMSEKVTGRKRKSYRAKDFSRSAMACPSCLLNFEEEVSACPRCGFSGTVAVQKFDFAAPPMTGVIDPTGQLVESARGELEKGLERLEKSFPQIRVSFCLMPGGMDGDLREFGFWLLNASPLDEENGEAERPWTILVVLDRARGQASLSCGYAVEPFLCDENVLELFRTERSGLYRGDYPKVLLRLLAGLEAILWDGAQRVSDYHKGVGK